jgi:hypothetical protein
MSIVSILVNRESINHHQESPLRFNSSTVQHTAVCLSPHLQLPHSPFFSHKQVSPDYAVPEELLAEYTHPAPAASAASSGSPATGPFPSSFSSAAFGGSPSKEGVRDKEGAVNTSKAYIVRLPCGPRDVYLRKEMLWPHIREFADRALAHIRKTLYGLSGEGKQAELYMVHGE